MLQTFAPYRETIRKRVEELSPVFPAGFCFIDSVANELKGTKAGNRTQVRVFDAAKAEIDGVARVVMPEHVPPAAEVPGLTAATLTTLLGIAPENMTVAQHKQISDAIKRVPGGGNPAATIGSLIQ
jgi:hypothetical protein